MDAMRIRIEQMSLAPIEHHDPDTDRWLWIESLNAPATIIRLSSSEFVATNFMFADLMDVDATDIVGTSVSNRQAAHGDV